MAHRSTIFILLTALAQADDKPRFTSAEECKMCHTRIPEPGASWSSGKWIGPYAAWQGSMMAHSSVDPYWKAKVQYEVEQVPTHKRAIEDTCLRCHAPMQQYGFRGTGRSMAMADLDSLGRDGVSCTVCHQILPEGLGKQSSFTANFRISAGNLIFGPHREPFTMPMLHHTGFEAREAKHILDSALCGSCHTVITQPPAGPNEKPVQFLEQSPFLEWLASSYPGDGKSCQSCHMPGLNDAQYIAHRPPGGPFPPTEPRRPFGKHEFIGGNVAIAELLKLNQTAGFARQQLERSLRLRVSTREAEESLLVNVETINLSGHKLPTGFPSRRLWLRVVLTSERGDVLFESGGWDAASGTLHAGETMQPHHALIERPDQVQVFETEAFDRQGRLTAALIRSAKHAKDNRILPSGFDARQLAVRGLSALHIDPVGVSAGANFKQGSATTVYKVPRPAAGSRLTVEALYQSIKPTYRPAAFQLPGENSRPVVVARIESSF